MLEPTKWSERLFHYIIGDVNGSAGGVSITEVRQIPRIEHEHLMFVLPTAETQNFLLQPNLLHSLPHRTYYLFSQLLMEGHRQSFALDCSTYLYIQGRGLCYVAAIALCMDFTI